MQIDYDSLAIALPNLDCVCSVEDMRKLNESLRNISKAIGDLANYAEARGNAMELRLRGEIEKAQKFEAAGASVYNRLPHWAKW